MKKLFLAFIIGMLFGSMAFADHEGLGVGLAGGAGGGLFKKDGRKERDGYGNLGLSLKIPNIPVFWAFYALFDDEFPGIGVTADFYIIRNNIISKEMSNSEGSYNSKLDYYFGIGGFLHMTKGYYFDIGLRVPVGLSWHIANPVELFLEVAPCFGLSNWRDRRPFHMGADAELGLRFWL